MYSRGHYIGSGVKKREKIRKAVRGINKEIKLKQVAKHKKIDHKVPWLGFSLLGWVV